MKLEFVTVDVFTERQFGGNPLAVVLNAEGLTTDKMQMIASEFNLAETTFVLPPKEAENTAHVRIFTPRAELPFAGHPNVGTAFVLAREGRTNGREVNTSSLLFEEAAGLVGIELIGEGSLAKGALVSAPQLFAINGEIDPEIVARACGLSASDIELKNHAPCFAGCGAPFVFVEVKSREVLSAAQCDASVFTDHIPAKRATGIHLYVHTPGDDVDVQARMFAPLFGIPEDPVTGGANVALVGLLAQLADEPDLSLSLRIGQGVDMGRPGTLSAEAIKQEGTIVKTVIGGECVEMMRGIINLR
jgi:trans-2,3-dihydro-3-hydroxyanthranilate isomerase